MKEAADQGVECVPTPQKRKPKSPPARWLPWSSWDGLSCWRPHCCRPDKTEAARAASRCRCAIIEKLGNGGDQLRERKPLAPQHASWHADRGPLGALCPR